MTTEVHRHLDDVRVGRLLGERELYLQTRAQDEVSDAVEDKRRFGGTTHGAQPTEHGANSPATTNGVTEAGFGDR